MLGKVDNETTRVYEKIHTVVFKNAKDASKAVAKEIAELIKAKAAKGELCVLGLATGSTPKHMYAELVRMHKEEGLSFKNVVSFNLDEYYPMKPDAIQSYVRFMREQLFDHIDILPGNWNVPDGTLAADEISEHCRKYEEKIESYGGIDLQVLGIGENGHIGFNESGSLINSKTRLIALDPITRINAAGDFGGMLNTPRRAITLGVQKIMEAKRVVLMAWGGKKARIIHDSVEGPMVAQVPASYLQTHSNTTFVIDTEAATELTRIKSPWLVEPIQWDKESTKKAVVRLAQKLKKPILQLTDQDYNNNGLNDLLASRSTGGYAINIEVFRQLQNTITGWPGGKPNEDDSSRPERATPAKKRVLLFSPHPDDDIISMGGTFMRLVEQGHDVHVAYQTSGNIAVADDEAIRFIDFMNDANERLGYSTADSSALLKKSIEFVKSKKAGEPDSPELRHVKGLMRRGEAKATCRYVGIPESNIHFLDLPFYETGKVEKNPIGAKDIEIISKLIDDVKPHQIYAAGDLADPHGTHKVCLDGIFAAIEALKSNAYMKECYVWLYRGAWHEWEMEEIEMAVPMSPIEVLRKRFGIFKHQSQKDGVVFQGADSREFWQRAEERNANTARSYNELGLTEYAAMEAFRRYHFM